MAAAAGERRLEDLVVIGDGALDARERRLAEITDRDERGAADAVAQATCLEPLRDRAAD